MSINWRKFSWKKAVGDLALLTLMALWDKIKDKVEDWRKPSE